MPSNPLEQLPPADRDFALDLTALVNEHLRGGADLGAVSGAMIGSAVDLFLSAGMPQHVAVDHIHTLARRIATQLARRT